jgi:sugar lactone lactonase YvrE
MPLSRSPLVLLAGIFGLTLTFFLVPNSSKLPYPYDAYESQEIPASHLPFFPGGSQPPLMDLYQDQDHDHDHDHDQSNNNKDWRSNVRRWFEGEIEGVESVAVTTQGKLILLDKYGYVHMAVPKDPTAHPADVEYILDGEHFQKLYIGPGRPLGYHILEGDDSEKEIVLLVCDSLKGLLQVHLQQRTIQVLTNVADDGKPINYANDLDVGPISGKVYFTASTAGVVAYNSNHGRGYYDTLRSCLLNYIQGDVSGRLLSYDFSTKETKVLLNGLFYANGVAVATDESYVLVAETWSYRILRLWLKGEKVGQVETFIGQLPGAPDGLSRSSKTTNAVWIGIVAKASPLGQLAPYPGLRQLVGSLLVPWLPQLSKLLMGSTAAIQVDDQGQVLQVLLDPKSETLASISGVTEYKGALFFGSLNGNYVSVMKTQ